jgi:hypothetical protein
MSLVMGTSRTSEDVRLESAKWANADVNQVAATNRDFMSTRPIQYCETATAPPPLPNAGSGSALCGARHASGAIEPKSPNDRIWTHSGHAQLEIFAAQTHFAVRGFFAQSQPTCGRRGHVAGMVIDHLASLRRRAVPLYPFFPAQSPGYEHVGQALRFCLSDLIKNKGRTGADARRGPAQAPLESPPLAGPPFGRPLLLLSRGPGSRPPPLAGPSFSRPPPLAAPILRLSAGLFGKSD